MVKKDCMSLLLHNISFRNIHEDGLTLQPIECKIDKMSKNNYKKLFFVSFAIYDKTCS